MFPTIDDVVVLPYMNLSRIQEFYDTRKIMTHEELLQFSIENFTCYQDFKDYYAFPLEDARLFFSQSERFSYEEADCFRLISHKFSAKFFISATSSRALRVAFARAMYVVDSEYRQEVENLAEDCLQPFAPLKRWFAEDRLLEVGSALLANNDTELFGKERLCDEVQAFRELRDRFFENWRR